MLSRLGLFFLAFVLLAVPATPWTAAAQEAEAPTIVLVLRHAETAPDGTRDPSLSEAGRQRAAALVEAARGAGVTAVYTSQLRRTRETAAALADTLGLPVRVAAIDGPTLDAYPGRLAAMILEKHRGEAVVVVNHSNTVPAIVAALGGGPAPPIAEDDYANLYVVVIPAEGRVRTVRTRYGAVD